MEGERKRKVDNFNAPFVSNVESFRNRVQFSRNKISGFANNGLAAESPWFDSMRKYIQKLLQQCFPNYTNQFPYDKALKQLILKINEGKPLTCTLKTPIASRPLAFSDVSNNISSFRSTLETLWSEGNLGKDEDQELPFQPFMLIGILEVGRKDIKKRSYLRILGGNIEFLGIHMDISLLGNIVFYPEWNLIRPFEKNAILEVDCSNSVVLFDLQCYFCVLSSMIKLNPPLNILHPNRLAKVVQSSRISTHQKETNYNLMGRVLAISPLTQETMSCRDVVSTNFIVEIEVLKDLKSWILFNSDSSIYYYFLNLNSIYLFTNLGLIKLFPNTDKERYAFSAKFCKDCLSFMELRVKTSEVYCKCNGTACVKYVSPRHKFCTKVIRYDNCEGLYQTILNGNTYEGNSQVFFANIGENKSDNKVVKGKRKFISQNKYLRSQPEKKKKKKKIMPSLVLNPQQKKCICPLISYQGIITKQHTFRVFELDNKFKLFFSHYPLTSFPDFTGLRVGALIKIEHVHFVLHRFFKSCQNNSEIEGISIIGFGCCYRSRVEILSLSTKKPSEIELKGSSVLIPYYQRLNFCDLSFFLGVLRKIQGKFNYKKLRTSDYLGSGVLNHDRHKHHARKNKYFNYAEEKNGNKKQLQCDNGIVGQLCSPYFVTQGINETRNIWGEFIDHESNCKLCGNRHGHYEYEKCLPMAVSYPFFPSLKDVVRNAQIKESCCVLIDCDMKLCSCLCDSINSNRTDDNKSFNVSGPSITVKMLSAEQDLDTQNHSNKFCVMFKGKYDSLYFKSIEMEWCFNCKRIKKMFEMNKHVWNGIIWDYREVVFYDVHFQRMLRSSIDRLKEECECKLENMEEEAEKGNEFNRGMNLLVGIIVPDSSGSLSITDSSGSVKIIVPGLSPDDFYKMYVLRKYYIVAESLKTVADVGISHKNTYEQPKCKIYVVAAKKDMSCLWSEESKTQFKEEEEVKNDTFFRMFILITKMRRKTIKQVNLLNNVKVSSDEISCTLFGKMWSVSRKEIVKHPVQSCKDVKVHLRGDGMALFHSIHIGDFLCAGGIYTDDGLFSCFNGNMSNSSSGFGNEKKGKNKHNQLNKKTMATEFGIHNPKHLSPMSDEELMICFPSFQKLRKIFCPPISSLKHALTRSREGTADHNNSNGERNKISFQGFVLKKVERALPELPVNKKRWILKVKDMNTEITSDVYVDFDVCNFPLLIIPGSVVTFFEAFRCISEKNSLYFYVDENAHIQVSFSDRFPNPFNYKEIEVKDVPLFRQIVNAETIVDDCSDLPYCYIENIYSDINNVMSFTESPLVSSFSPYKLKVIVKNIISVTIWRFCSNCASVSSSVNNSNNSRVYESCVSQSCIKLPKNYQFGYECKFIADDGTGEVEIVCKGKHNVMEVLQLGGKDSKEIENLASVLGKFHCILSENNNNIMIMYENFVANGLNCNNSCNKNNGSKIKHMDEKKQNLLNRIKTGNGTRRCSLFAFQNFQMKHNLRDDFNKNDYRDSNERKLLPAVRATNMIIESVKKFSKKGELETIMMSDGAFTFCYPKRYLIAVTIERITSYEEVNQLINSLSKLK